MEGRKWAAMAALAVLVTAVFLPVAGNGFIDLDDGKYVTQNPWVSGGLTWKGAAWAVTDMSHSSNWHPLTWLSHMLDVQLFGLRAGPHHLVSLALHLAGTLLLFLALAALTGHYWPSLFAAALFGIHPLHVESVAWVAERKDVLSAFFWMAGLSAYARYVRRPSAGRRAAIFLPLVLGLTAKAMLVTFPLVLLLLDVWPLARWRPAAGGRIAGRLLAEKAPLFALSLVFSGLAFVAQRAGGAVRNFEDYPFLPRLGNTLISYAAYALKTVWPSGLIIFYPHPRGGLPWLEAVASLVLLAAVTWGVLRLGRVRPYLAVGWFWYLGTLVPVIGLVQIGGQARADRYTYLPLIGLFIGAAWGWRDLSVRAAGLRKAVPVAALAATLALAWAARVQVGYWRDSITVFGRAIEVMPGNWLARTSLGYAYHQRKMYGEAVEQYRSALETRPGYFLARYDLGVSLFALGRLDEALEQFQAAVRAKPDYAEAYVGVGQSLFWRGKVGEAEEWFKKALSIDPDLPSAREAMRAARRFAAPGSAGPPAAP